LIEKASKFSLPRLHSSSIHKSSSIASRRPSSSSNNGSPQKSPNDFGMYDEKEKEKSFTTLRKRNSSNPNPSITAAIRSNVPETANGVTGFIKEGANIMDQIGVPDHTGWMRKRGDRFNSWKSRYFILKGPHLYFLRSNHKSVCCAPPLFFLIEILISFVRKLESRDISILVDIRLRLMKMLILDDTVSGLIMIMIRRITSAQRRRMLSESG
jgi:hypothetical protein